MVKICRSFLQPSSCEFTDSKGSIPLEIIWYKSLIQRALTHGTLVPNSAEMIKWVWIKVSSRLDLGLYLDHPIVKQNRRNMVQWLRRRDCIHQCLSWGQVSSFDLEASRESVRCNGRMFHAPISNKSVGQTPTRASQPRKTPTRTWLQLQYFGSQL